MPDITAITAVPAINKLNFNWIISTDCHISLSSFIFFYIKLTLLLSKEFKIKIENDNLYRVPAFLNSGSLNKVALNTLAFSINWL